MKKETQDVSIPVLEDEAIIELYWNREETAIRETDRKYGKYLYKMAFNILADRLDSEECLNDTYLGTWNRIPPTRPNVFHAFLARIMRNVAIDRFRERSAAKRIPSEFVVSLDELKECVCSSSDVNREYELGEMIRILNEFLNQQSEEKELIFVCRYYYGDSISDIARMLGLNESSIYRDLMAMRSNLKKRMEAEGYGNE